MGLGLESVCFRDLSLVPCNLSLYLQLCHVSFALVCLGEFMYDVDLAVIADSLEECITKLNA